MAQSAYEPLRSVLVTGGCGFIGRSFVSFLQATEPDCKIVVLDIVTPPAYVFPGVEYHQIDIADEPAMLALFKTLEYPPQVIIHSACPSSLVHDDALHWRTNVTGTRVLLDCARSLGTVKAFVCVSTSSVVHDNVSDLVYADESLPLLKPPRQKRVYTLTKAYSEEDVVEANGTGGMRTAIVRPCLVFGPGDELCARRMATLALTGRVKFQMGPGTNAYDFVYVDNVSHLLLLISSALLRGTPDGVAGGAFHVSNGEPMPFWGFPLALSRAMGRPVSKEELRIIPLWWGLTMGFLIEWLTWIFTLGRKQPRMSVETVSNTFITRTLSIEKARRVLGYEPIVSMQEGIARTAQWFLDDHAKQKN